jgi:dihydrolipoamide dehydrogenase
MKICDTVVIGGGPGGYVCAIKLAQLGHKVVCIEKKKFLGGTCLNEGCIPSKSLLNSSHLYWEAQHSFAKHGIIAEKISCDLSKMMQQKTKTIAELAHGIDSLFSKNKIEKIVGHGTIKSPEEVMINGSQTVKAKNIVIASGSEVSTLPNVKIDEKHIISSTSALELKSIPKEMVIIGAGVIGVEMASIWGRLGAEVLVVEFLDHITPSMDLEISKTLQKILAKQGIKFSLSTKVLAAEKTKTGAGVTLESGSVSRKESADLVLVAVGRKPCTQGLGLEEMGIERDERGRIKVDANFATNISNIYAIGDVIRGPMLAHKSEEEGVAVAEILSGQKPHIDYGSIPSVIYTHPEVAAIGKTEEDLKQQNIEYKIGKFPFMANSRARVNLSTEGFVKILVDKHYDTILGAHIIGPQAGTLVGELSVAMAYGASSEDIARICHSHPDLNEAIKEAALAAFFKPIHT